MEFDDLLHIVLSGIEIKSGKLELKLFKKTRLIEFIIFFLFNGKLLVPSPGCIALKLCEGLHVVLLPFWAFAVIFEVLSSLF